jgi:dTDP-4-dehydrorhamnose 3,5-epimerase
MNIAKTAINDLLVIQINPIDDPRGEVVQLYEKEAFIQFNINENFNQDIITNSQKKNTVRGLHFQRDPFQQTKLVRCQRGAIKDVTVDLRKSSPTFQQIFYIDLKEDDWKWLYIPSGIAHGFVTLVDHTQVTYKISGEYSREHATGINWNDPVFNIDLKVKSSEVILSTKDRNLPNFNEKQTYFP